MDPLNEALDKSGLKISEIDEIQLLGGGVRIPSVHDLLQKETQKELSVKMNGDEAMCFGAAFIASNCSSDFKVKQIFLTQHPENDIYIKISPINASDFLSAEEQAAEGIEEDAIIKYTQEFRLFNTSDYIGKSKALNLNYNKNMKVELFKAVDNNEETLELLDTFLLNDLKFQLEYETK
jgi:hypoxia up-regulated 1